MNKNIMNKLGFEKEVKRVENSRCPFCGNEINIFNFKDSLSAREFKISGLCQICQDKTFGV